MLTEGQHAGEFIVSEANGSRSRDKITVLMGEVLVAGAVLGKVTASGKYIARVAAAVDGSEVAAAILFDAVDATAADVDVVTLIRDAEVNGGEIAWEAAIAGPDLVSGIAELATVGVVVR
ncbi:MAG: head decoration protein [Candidatus Scalindua sp.]|nr:head decoration protein [Candidatus Scalindua sp.]